MRDTLSNYFDATAKNQFSKMFEKYAPKLPTYEPSTPSLKFNGDMLNITWNDQYWHWIELGTKQDSNNLYRHNTTLQPSLNRLDVDLNNKLTNNATVYLKFWTWDPYKSVWTNANVSIKYTNVVITTPDPSPAPDTNDKTTTFRYDNGYMRNLPSYVPGSKLIRRSNKSMKIEIIGKDKNNYWLKYKYDGQEYWSAKWLTNISNTDFSNLKIVN